MKKLLTILGVTVASLAYSQGGTMIVNNYSVYEYRGALIANNFSGGCYPIIGTTDTVVIHPDSHIGNGQALVYPNYKDQFTLSLYPMPNWTVNISATSSNVRPWNHGSLMPGGVFSNNTKWSSTKFAMYDTATSSYVTGFNANLSIAGNPCNGSGDYFATPSGANSAEMFTITTSTGLVETYLQLY
ncbi:hypothetical protein B0A69_05480 [Chryseobacterium shigense]|uniref:Uncharacterized protein n=1 Tax=Chryseobacterium shigense TaxID=297244 RepID=A0A1N7IL80_9FLAO|nr:hypothetical protein [Chryseobacterium shigense]PQA95821.1 hypothetical protein B0A69_05480 [Chryseobacterium shigense]SIS37825.1 hypothetical protein SAMN05421639_104168 [Chryseobacterium shigense]